MNNLKEERLKILDLLQSGKINSKEAEMLLSALGNTKEEESNPKTNNKNPFKMLRIQIDSSDGEKVRVNIPIEFAKLLKKGKFGNANLGEYDIDVDSIIELVGSGAEGELLSVDTEDGDKIKIFVG